MTVYLSNKLDELAKHLTKNVSTSPSFFSKQIIIVPNLTIKDWLSFYLADHSAEKIAMGPQFLYLHQAIDMICQQEKAASELKKILKIKEKVGESYSFLSCRKLSTLFDIYALYGRGILEERLSDCKNFQNDLWRQLSQEFIPRYKYKDSEHCAHSHFHLFGFNHLPYLYFSLFHELSKSTSVNIYHLSPCKEFWSESFSDRDAKRFLKNRSLKQEHKLSFEEYLEDHHPLLANLGKVGREFAFLVEESEWVTQEFYIEEEPSTQLKGVQKDLLTLTRSFAQYTDKSIQVHISTTKHREIQNLYNTLSFLIAEENIEPKEILVMAPDISDYVPYIKAYFGQEIGYRISDVPLEWGNGEIRIFFKLMALEEKRWSVEALLALFSDPLFSKRWGDHEIALIKKWINIGNIKWGYDHHHANALLQKRYCEVPMETFSVSWSSGICRLFKKIVQFQETNEIDFVESALLGELSFLLKSLYHDLRALYDGTKRSWKEWMDYLEHLYKNYLSFENHTIIEKFHSLREDSLPFCFPDLWPLLKTLLSQEKITLNKNRCQAISFSSMFPMRITPAHVIVLIGMQHDAFPRKDPLSSHNLLGINQKKSDYFPSYYDADRYLFLEALLSAKKYFLLSYLGKSPYDQTALPESSCISELLRYLNPKNVIVHPDLSFDPAYFQNHDLLKNGSEKDFRAARALFIHEKKKSYFFSFRDSLTEVPEGEHVIDIAQLRRLIRTPITYYLEKNYHISFKKESKEIEEFFLSPAHVGKARRFLGNLSLNQISENLLDVGALPSGIFKQLALYRLSKEEEWVKPYSLKRCEFSLQATTVTHHEEGWKHPKLVFDYDEKRKIHFVGTIPHVYDKGLFIFENCEFSSAIKYWSDFLMLTFSRLGEPSSLIFGKEKKEKNRFFSDPKPFLKTLVDYYFWAQKKPSFLIPEWADSILSGKWEHIALLIEEKKGYDEGAYWSLKELSLKNINQEELHMKCSLLFGDMKNAWF